MGNGEREAYQSENMLKTLIENSIPSTWKIRLILLVVISISISESFIRTVIITNPHLRAMIQFTNFSILH